MILNRQFLHVCRLLLFKTENMEDLLRKLPSPLIIEGRLHRLVITKLKDKWLVSYDAYDNNQQYVWRFNPKLYIALNMMIAYLYQHKLIEEERPNVDFKQLEEVNK